MIKRLKKKFIFINMFLISIVLLTIFSVLNLYNYQKLKGESLRAMDQALNKQLNSPPFFEIGRKTVPRPMSPFPVFIVKLSADGSMDMVNQNNVTIADKLLKEAVDRILSSDSATGLLQNLDLRYQVKTLPDGTYIALTDRSYERSSFRNMLITSLAVIFGALLAFFFISLLLAKWALKPVRAAWVQQRRFVADASHELKTPLTVILANINILMGHRQDTIEQQLQWLSNTKAEATRMKELVDQLLFLAKADSLQPVLNMEKFNLSNAILSCLLPFESIAFEDGIILNESVEPDIYIKGNESQMKQLFIILLDNACKYSGKKGSVSIALSKKQNTITLHVNNSGSFIPTNDLSHIFERFYRSDKSRSREQGGYGLGLAIAKTITDVHHGKITVASSIQEGTTFTVSFPGLEK